MREKVFPWLGQEFVSLSCEGRPRGSIVEETRDIFARFDTRLQAYGLSLANTVRTRLWARDMDCWRFGVEERAQILSGKARSVSSSHIRPERFASEARIAVDMLAMRVAPEIVKEAVEYDPPGIVLRYLKWGSVVFLSGVTVILPGFEDQLLNVVKRIGDTLAQANLTWANVARASFFLHHSLRLNDLRESFAQLVETPIPCMDHTFVDTRQGKLVEIETTAVIKSGRLSLGI